MEEDIKKTFDDLFYKIVVIGRLNLSFIEDLKSFCDDFKDHKHFAEYRIKVKSNISMIYFDNEVFDKSFEIDFKLLQENSIEKADYYIAVGRVAKSSSILMRTDEVKEYVNKFIINENVKHFLAKLSLLDWYAFHYPHEVEHNDNFEKVFSEIEQALGAPPYTESPLTERIKKLKILNHDSARNVLHQFHMLYQQAAPELRPAILEEYINKTPLKYYKDIMINASKKTGN